MIKNRHFCCCCCCCFFFFFSLLWLFVCSFSIIKKQYFEVFFVSLPFFLYFRALAWLFYGRFASFFQVPDGDAATTVCWIILYSMRYPIFPRVYSKQSHVHFRLHCLKVGDVKDKRNEWVRSVTFISLAFDDRSLLIVLVSLYFLFFHFGSSDNTKEICFFKMPYYSRAKIWCVIYVKRVNFSKTFIGKTKQTC